MIRRIQEKLRLRHDMKLCREAIEHVQTIVDGELPATKRTAELIEHLDKCGGCGVEAEKVRELKAAIARCSCGCDEEMVSRLRDFASRIPEIETS